MIAFDFQQTGLPSLHFLCPLLRKPLENQISDQMLDCGAIVCHAYLEPAVCCLIEPNMNHWSAGRFLFLWHAHTPHLLVGYKYSLWG